MNATTGSILSKLINVYAFETLSLKLYFIFFPAIHAVSFPKALQTDRFHPTQSESYGGFPLWNRWSPEMRPQCIHLSSLNRLNGTTANQMTFELRAADLSWMQSLNILTLLFTHNPSLLAPAASSYFQLTPWSIRAGDIISLHYIPTKMIRHFSTYWQTDKLKIFKIKLEETAELRWDGCFTAGFGTLFV